MAVYRFIVVILFVLCDVVFAEEATLVLSPVLTGTLRSAWQQKQGVYVPRTQHWRKDGRPEFINRLILEDSPYLLQHAHNPIDWFAWSEEVLQLAQQQNKPVFLSVGYSTCFWCHVMAEESFDNLEVAKLLNAHFISVKVDRETRPDIDAHYMASVEHMTGSAGWPLSVFLLPDGSAFLGGGYFSPEAFISLLSKVRNLWQQVPGKLELRAKKLAKQLEQKNAIQTNLSFLDVSDAALLAKAKDKILMQYDHLYGGFGYQAKFPHENWLLFLLSLYAREPEPLVHQVLDKTLRAMAYGGINDQLAGGFHRYATDPRWLIPHFEKMLYTQAQLSRVYLLMYQLTEEPFYAEVAQQTIDYVLTDLAFPVGGFYAATDALSRHGEGDYFLWPQPAFEAAVGKDLGALATALFSVTPEGDYQGKNILYRRQSLAEHAALNQLEFVQLKKDFLKIKTALLASRNSRVPPFKDKKIIAGWNAMMIESLVLANEVLKKPEYLRAAVQSADFIWWNQFFKDKKLYRVFLQSHASFDGALDDYAYYASALLSLYDATGEPVWLARVIELTDIMISLFWDPHQGGFFVSSVAMQGGVKRFKSFKDHEVVAANAIALKVLLRLAKRTGNTAYQDKAVQLMTAFASFVLDGPIEYIGFFSVLGEHLKGEIAALQYAAKGNLVVKGVYHGGKEGVLSIVFDIKPGWHINAHQPLQDYLVPTLVEVVDLPDTVRHIVYPAGLVKRLGFQEHELALYQGRVKVKVPLKQVTGNMIRVKVKLQACNEQFCLPPEDLLLHVPKSE